MKREEKGDRRASSRVRWGLFWLYWGFLDRLGNPGVRYKV